MARVRRQQDGAEDWDVTVYGYDWHGNVTRRTDDGREHDDGAVADGADQPQRIRHVYHPVGWERGRYVEQLDAGVWRRVQRTVWIHHANGKLHRLHVHNREHDTAAEYYMEYRDAEGRYVNGHRTREWYYRGLQIDGDACALTACDMRYTYDARDRLVAHDNGRGGVTTFELDPAGNVLAADGPDGPRTFTYDGAQLTSLTAAGATQHYHYDERARLACVTLEIAGDPGSGDDCSPATGQSPSPNVLADYGYDPLDRLRTYRSFLVDPAGGPAQFDQRAYYDYDALDRLVAQTEQPEGHADPTVKLYEHLGLTNLVTAEHRHDSLDRPLGSKYFTYDAFGHRISMTDDPEAAFDPDPTRPANDSATCTTCTAAWPCCSTPRATPAPPTATPRSVMKRFAVLPSGGGVALAAVRLAVPVVIDVASAVAAGGTGVAGGCSQHRHGWPWRSSWWARWSGAGGAPGWRAELQIVDRRLARRGRRLERRHAHAAGPHTVPVALVRERGWRR